MADGLDEMSKDPLFRSISHPLLLAFMLLGDWVFNQRPTTQARVVSQLFAEPRSRFLLATRAQSRGSDALALPERAGRAELVIECKRQFEKKPASDTRLALGRILVENTSSDERFQYWVSKKPRNAKNREGWLQRGAALDVFRNLPASVLQEEAEEDAKIVPFAIRAGSFDLLRSSPLLLGLALEHLLQGMGGGPFVRASGATPLEKVGVSFSPSIYHALFHQDRRALPVNMSLADSWHFDHRFRSLFENSSCRHG